MDFLYSLFMIFSVFGAIDYISGNRFGLGKEFEKGFTLLGNCALSMIGMIVIAPVIGDILQPVFDISYKWFGIDSSITPVMFLANDMGGTSLAIAVAQNENWGMFHGLVTSSMMGVTLSFTIPVVLEMADIKQHKDILLGFLCGIATIPIGCIVSAFLYGFQLSEILLNYLPLFIFALFVAVGLLLIPNLCVKILNIFGALIKSLIVIGLVFGILEFLTGKEILPGLGTFEEGAYICYNAAAVMSGAFPCLYFVSKLLSNPLRRIAKKMDIDEDSVFGFISSLISARTTFKNYHLMKPKGIVLNSAFAVSAAFTFGSHLSFTMSVNKEYPLYVIIGKLISGISSLFLADFIYKKVNAHSYKI